jgi:hypothetical protein
MQQRKRTLDLGLETIHWSGELHASDVIEHDKTSCESRR